MTSDVCRSCFRPTVAVVCASLLCVAVAILQPQSNAQAVIETQAAGQSQGQSSTAQQSTESNTPARIHAFPDATGRVQALYSKPAHRRVGTRLHPKVHGRPRKWSGGESRQCPSQSKWRRGLRCEPRAAERMRTTGKKPLQPQGRRSPGSQNVPSCVWAVQSSQSSTQGQGQGQARAHV